MTDPVIAAAEALVTGTWAWDLGEKDRGHYLTYGRATADAALGALGLHVPMFPAQPSDSPAARLAYLLDEADALMSVRKGIDARIAALCAEVERLLP